MGTLYTLGPLLIKNWFYTGYERIVKILNVLNDNDKICEYQETIRNEYEIISNG